MFKIYSHSETKVGNKQNVSKALELKYNGLFSIFYGYVI